MVLFLLVALLLATLLSVIGLSTAVWMASKDLEVTRTKEPIAIVQPVEPPAQRPGQAPPPSTNVPRGQVVRVLTNVVNGNSIEVTLISKTDTTVTFMLDGKRHDYDIGKLSPADREFIARWQP